MNKKLLKYLQTIVLIIDLFVINCSFLISFSINQKLHDLTNPYYPIYLWIIFNFFWIILSLLTGIYFEKIIYFFESFMKKSVHHFFIWTIACLLSIQLYNNDQINRFIIPIFILSSAIGVSINRVLYFGIKKYFKKKENLFNNAIILGYNQTALKLANYFFEDNANVKLLGFIEDDHRVKELTPYPILGKRDDLLEIALHINANEIYSTLKPDENLFLHDIIQEAEKECIKFRIVPDLSYFFPKQIVVQYIRDLPILSSRSEPLEDILNRIQKRALDLIISLLVIVFVLSWLIPLMGILIVIETKGPIFFIQKRTGKNKKIFNCLKFRSMFINNTSNEIQATRNDSRVTLLGKFLRKSSLDEFPQFINVFKGEMSVVGPRPHMVKHTQSYAEAVDEFMIRHYLKPGITGWAQVNGFRGEIKNTNQIKKRVESDIWYLENWSIWLDLKIIFLTIYKICKGDKQAY
jgi:putative colanic acid biosynthesis UDP-glucose lipid carrier transferase